MYSLAQVGAIEGVPDGTQVTGSKNKDVKKKINRLQNKRQVFNG